MALAVTGAAGGIGSQLVPALEEHTVTAVDREPVPDPGYDGFESRQLDIVTDTDALHDAFRDVDVVVHLAAAAGADGSWDDVVPANLNGTYRVYEAAAESGVDRVVFASSNHVVDAHNVADGATGSYKKTLQALDVDLSPAPTGPYGISKVAGETTGTYFAMEHGIEVVNVRIGWFMTEERLRERQEEGEHVAQSARSKFLSHRDACHGFRRTIVADLPENPLTVNLLSENADRALPLTHTMRSIGYRPRDDSSEILSAGNARTED